MPRHAIAMRTKPEILKTTLVARSRLFRIEQLELRFSNGVETVYERLRGSAVGAVLVVPVLGDGTLLLIREYAAGTERYELGFPKGRVESGEQIFEAANRELMEEIGYGSRRIESLRTMTLSPAYLGHATHVLLARDLYPKRLPGDEPEAIEVVPWPLDDINGLLCRDDFTEARSIAALFIASARLRDGVHS